MSETTERFTRGAAIGVDVTGVERELAALWREAAKGATGVMRACSWNLVVYAEDDASLARARELAELVVEAISARCKLLPGGGKMLCTEEITLESRRQGVEYLPSLTRALLVPDIPTAVLCVGVPQESVLLQELVSVADRVVFDSHGREFESIRHLGAKCIDLAWLRLARWQSAVADGYVPGAALELDVPAKWASEGRWMAAWLRSRGLPLPPQGRGEDVSPRDEGGASSPRPAPPLEERETSVRFGEGPFISDSLSPGDAHLLSLALSSRALTPAWKGARDAIESTPSHGLTASWSDFAARFVKAATVAIAERGVFTCALTGGSAVKMYPLLAKEKLDWSRIELFLSDERLVPLESPDSNYRAAREALPMAKLHPVRVALPPDEAAADYARQLPDHLDLIHVGMGPDGHVASLFPEHRLLREQRVRVGSVTDSPKPPKERVTFTLPTFATAREVWFLVVGESKKPAAHAARTDSTSRLPAALVQRSARSTTWFLDL
jgi:6-phosphogluconolactonase